MKQDLTKKYQAGDKVEFKGTAGYYLPGTVYTVTSVEPKSLYISCEQGSTTIQAWELDKYLKTRS